LIATVSLRWLLNCCAGMLIPAMSDVFRAIRQAQQQFFDPPLKRDHTPRHSGGRAA
jgi:hypothetical protein